MLVLEKINFPKDYHFYSRHSCHADAVVCRDAGATANLHYQASVNYANRWWLFHASRRDRAGNHSGEIMATASREIWSRDEIDCRSSWFALVPGGSGCRQNTGQLVPSDRLAEVPTVEVRLERDRVCRAAVSVRAIMFVRYSPDGSAQFSPCSPGTAALELIRNCINFSDHKQVAM